MSFRLYLDVHVPYAICAELRLRGIDVVTAQEDGAGEWSDAKLFARASSLGRILVTQDDDLLSEAAAWQRENRPFVGVIYARQSTVSIGQCVLDLELIAKASRPDEWYNRIAYLPLK